MKFDHYKARVQRALGLDKLLDDRALLDALRTDLDRVLSELAELKKHALASTEALRVDLDRVLRELAELNKHSLASSEASRADLDRALSGLVDLKKHSLASTEALHADLDRVLTALAEPKRDALAHSEELRADLQQIVSGLAEQKRHIVQLREFLEDSPGVRSIYVEENTAMVKLRRGPRMYVDSRDIGVGSWLMQQGRWEPQYTHHVLRLVKPGFVCVDGGAHLGYYTMIMATRVGPKGKVLSFEPNPRLYELLHRSIQLNGFHNGVVSAFRCALADRNGTAELTFEVGQFGGGNIFSTEEMRRNLGLSVANVELKRLDEFPIDPSKPLFMKLDTEGAEYLILKGSEKHLEAISDVIVMMEFTPLFIRKHLPTREFLTYLRGLRFRFFVVDPGEGWPLVEATEDEIEKMGETHLFLARRNIAERP